MTPDDHDRTGHAVARWLFSELRLPARHVQLPRGPLTTTDVGSGDDVFGRFALAGQSMGGQIAMDIVARSPERARGLLLAATTPAAETARSRAARFRAAERIAHAGPAAIASELLSMMVSPATLDHDPQLAAAVLAMMRRADARGAAGAQRARACRPDYADTLAGFRRPATVVGGGRDAYTRAQTVEEMRRHLDAELLWLPNAGHLPNLEQPDQVNRAFDELAARIIAHDV